MRKAGSVAGALVAALVLGGCGGGGGGGAGTPVVAPPVPTDAFARTVALSTTEALPAASAFTSVTGGGRLQMLFRATNVGAAGVIQTIRFRLAEASSLLVACPGVTVTLGHTSLTALGTTFDSNYVDRGSPVNVIGPDATVVVPTGALDDYVAIPLTTPFTYNGTDSLVLEIRSNSGCRSAAPDMRRSVAIYQALLTGTSFASTTGTGALELFDVRFGFARGDDRLARLGAPLPSNTVPFDGTTPRIQLLYRAADIASPGGPITGVGFPLQAQTSADADFTVTVTLAHTSVATLDTTFANNVTGTSTEVATGASFHVPNGTPAGQYVWLPFTAGPFTYNGTDNLVVEIAVTAGTGSLNWRARVGDAGVMARVVAPGPTDATGTASQTAHDVALRFDGGPIHVLTPNGVSDTSLTPRPFASAGGRHQFLYLTSEVGTKGTLTGLACRLQGNVASTSTYPGYTVTLAHTTSTALDPTFANNLTDPAAAQVFSGLVTVAGGSRKGDWVEIPFATPFAYDGASNLVVDIAGGAGTGDSFCMVDQVATTLYGGRWLQGAAPLDATGTLANGLLVTRFLLN